MGDPFLQFKVTTSQGEQIIGPRLFRKRFTTNQPIKNQRTFEIDLTKQLPTKYSSTGDFTGDVIRYIGVGITDSDYGKAREVPRTDFEGLPADQQGDIEYFRKRLSGSPTLLSGKEEWDALAGTDHQGPVIYNRREQPRLAEIEVWTVGENIGIGLIEPWKIQPLRHLHWCSEPFVTEPANTNSEVGSVSTHCGDHTRPFNASNRVHDRLAHCHCHIEEKLIV